jgi:hypothetical protein
MARPSPPFVLLTAENREIARDVSALPQPLHTAGAWAWLIGRSLSNLMPQSAQRYSYTGIV